MRQVLDMLVWLGVIMVAVAVVYFAPRCAALVRRDGDPARANVQDLPGIHDAESRLGRIESLIPVDLRSR